MKQEGIKGKTKAGGESRKRFGKSKRGGLCFGKPELVCPWMLMLHISHTHTVTKSSKHTDKRGKEPYTHIHTASDKTINRDHSILVYSTTTTSFRYTLTLTRAASALSVAALIWTERKLKP